LATQATSFALASPLAIVTGPLKALTLPGSVRSEQFGE
jgi:hypothetical protein